MDKALLELDEHRYVNRRSSKLKRITDLRATVTEAIAWSELGYSSSGIARRMDTNEDTVGSWMEEAMARYGLSIAEAVGTHEKIEDPEKVDPDYVGQLKNKDKAKWIEYVVRHGDKWEDEWVESVFAQAKGHVTVQNDAHELESMVNDKIKSE